MIVWPHPSPQAWRRLFGLGLGLGIAALVWTLPAKPGPQPTLAQAGNGWRLYGHDNGHYGIIEVDTASGRARTVGATGFDSGSAAMAAAGAEVLGPGGRRFPAGTFFGLLGDSRDGRDYLTVSDPTTGYSEKLVATSRDIGGRGIAFGPDGTTLYLLESDGELSTVDTVTGRVSWVATVRDGSGQVYGASSLELDPDRRSLLAIGSIGRSSALLQISPATGRAIVLGQLPGLNACTLVRAPAAVPGPGGVDLPAGTWMTFDTTKGTLIALDVDLAARSASIGRVIGPLGPESSGTICGAAFAAPLALPPTPSPTPSPSQPASPTPDPGATPVPGCVCREVRARVPVAVINDAMANPERYLGWRELLDPNKPPSPANPPRECLTLRDRNIPFHPLWNGPIWRVGCP